MPKLFYAGPSVDVLIEEYAKVGRIDQLAPRWARASIDIQAPVARVWKLLGDPAGWSDVDPDIHNVEIDSPVEPGARFKWKNGRASIKSRFVIVAEPREISWVGVSMGAKAVHRHVLEPLDASRTRLMSEESMSGLFLTLLFSDAKLDAALTKWLDAIKVAAERPSL